MTDKIAIVGAGAMGVVTGYHLGLAGVDVTLLVRPERVADIPSTYRLYSYDDGSVHEFSGFQIASSAEELARADYAFIIITLDGAALANSEGQTLLNGIGDAIRDRDTAVILGSVGIGLRELAIASLGIPDRSVISGLFAMLAQQTTGLVLPVHEPTDAIRLAQSDFGFRHLNEGGFLLEARNDEAVSRFVELYDRCNIAKCFVVPPEIFARKTRDIFPVFLAGEIAGWPKAEELVNDKELWPLTVEAVRAIQGLKEHGEAGQMAATELTSESLAAMWIGAEKAALPLDFPGFNAYHHGRKIRSADIALLEGCIARGESERRDMSAVKKLLGLAGVNSIYSTS